MIALAMDHRLSHKERLLALWRWGHGEEWVVTSLDEWSFVLAKDGERGRARTRTITEYLDALISYGWLERQERPGQPNAYRPRTPNRKLLVALASTSPLFQDEEPLSPGDTPVSSGQGSPLSPGDSTVSRRQGSEGGTPVSSRQGSGGTPVSRRQGSASTPVSRRQGSGPEKEGEGGTIGGVGGVPSSSEEEVVVGGVGENAREGSYSLDPQVADLIDSEEFKGCRGALSDYMQERVIGPKQYGYVQTLRSWKNGGLGQPRGWGEMEPEAQNANLAVALNELLADDETKFKSSRGQEGNTATLRSKIEYLIRREKATGIPATESPESKHDDHIE